MTGRDSEESILNAIKEEGNSVKELVQSTKDMTGELGGKLDVLIDLMRQMLARTEPTSNGASVVLQVVVLNSCQEATDKEVAEQAAETQATLEENAEHSQQEFLAFNTVDIYRTIVNPFPRTQKELIEYGTKAANLYTNMAYKDPVHQFKDEFQHWTEEHFKVLPTSVTASLLDSLIEAGKKYPNVLDFASHAHWLTIWLKFVRIYGYTMKKSHPMIQARKKRLRIRNRTRSYMRVYDGQ